MKTKDFPYLSFPFSDFNQSQSMAIPLIVKDCNIIVSFPPATGKTAIAEAAFAYSLTKNKKVAYVCPLKALANQKKEEWDKLFSSYKSVVISGDSGNRIEDFQDSHIFIFTSESFDSSLRSKQKLFKDFDCVCFDEAHLIGDEDRGTAYESSIMRITSVNKDCRLLLLSGTLSNAREVAKWIKLLNGKETRLCASDWRPIEFSLNFHYVEKYEEIEEVIKLLRLYIGSKTIVFVHSKILGKKICDSLRKEKIRHAFHNANLTEHKRKTIESLFSEKYSNIDVLVTTSTLSAGVNLI